MGQVRSDERYYWIVKDQGWIIGPVEAKPGDQIKWAGKKFTVVKLEDGKLRVRPVEAKGRAQCSNR